MEIPKYTIRPYKIELITLAYWSWPISVSVILFLLFFYLSLPFTVTYCRQVIITKVKGVKGFFLTMETN